MKLFFLGGTSYLGQEIIKALSGEHEISAYVRSDASADKISNLNIKIVTEDTLKSLEEQEVVFNLVVDYGKGDKPLSEIMATNVQFPLKILEKIKFNTILNFSTALDKNVSSYSFTKRTLEEALMWLGQAKGFKTLNLRLQHFYGPGAPPHNFITFLFHKMMNHEDVPLTDCQQKRDFIYIDDLLDSVKFILERLSVLENQVIEIGSGEAPRLQRVVEEIHRLTDSRSQLLYGNVPRRVNEPSELKADIFRLKELGWSPQIKIAEGLRKIKAGLEEIR